MKKSKQNNQTALAALTASAMALPAFQTQAATAPTENVVSYRSSNYSEDSAPASSVATGSTDRYDIDIQQLSLLAPVGKNFSLKFDALTEKLSGASPLGTQQGPDGKPQLVMSGASGTGINEDRDDYSAHGTYYGDGYSTGLTYGQSTENDYKATYYGVDWEVEFNNKNTAFQVAVSQSDDKLSPTDAVLYGRVQSAEKETQSFSIGLSQVISKTKIIQFGLSATEDSGYLSDPYKTSDLRPSTRNRVTATTRYRSFSNSSNAAMHLDYRYYSDDWEVTSHTLGFAWHQNMGSSFVLIPSLRYYTQTEASFYEPYQTAGNTNPYYSSDYRLSPYGAISAGLKFVHNFQHFSYTASIERYESSGDYSFEKVAVEHPGLVNFTRITIGFDIKF